MTAQTGWDDALQHGAETFIDSISIEFIPRGVPRDDADPGAQFTPTSFNLTATQRTLPTATATFTIEGDLDVQHITPDNNQLWRAEIRIRLGIVGNTIDFQEEVFRLWVTGAETRETVEGVSHTITAVSADWILTNHRFRNDTRREVINRDVDNFWRTRFQIPVTGVGMDPFFSEFVNLSSGITAATEGGPSGAVWIPLAAESNMHDVAAILAAYWGRYPAGIVSSAAPPPGTWEVYTPTITLAPFFDETRRAKDLRARTGRILERVTRFNDDWAERILHNRRWSAKEGEGAVEYQEVTAYGTPVTDLRPQITHETWNAEEVPEAMAAMLERVKARRWITTITTRLDLDLWLGGPVLTDDGFRWITDVAYNFDAGTMTITTDQSDTDALFYSWNTMPMRDSYRIWSGIIATEWANIGLL